MKSSAVLFKALADPTRLRILKLLQAGRYCVCELTDVLGLAQPTVSRHLKVLENAGLVEAERAGQRIDYVLACPDAESKCRDLLNLVSRWHNEDPELQRLREKIDGAVRMRRLKHAASAQAPFRVLFVCTQNACRSQMAEGLVNHDLSGRVQAFSAGTAPAAVHPLAVEAMKAIGIDISAQRAKSLETFSGQSFDLVVTLCDEAAERCPAAVGLGPTVHLGFEAPARVKGGTKARLAAFATVRDAMRRDVVPFLQRTLGLKG